MLYVSIIAIDDKTLFRRIGNYHAQETSFPTTLLFLVLEKTRVPVFLVEMKFKLGELVKFYQLLYGPTYRLKPRATKPE